jgi:hypothetical protein
MLIVFVLEMHHVCKAHDCYIPNAQYYPNATILNNANELQVTQNTL